MKKTLLLVAFATLAMGAITTSCKKKGEEPKEKNEVKTVKFLDVHDWKKWIYYSFKENKVVKVADYKEDLSGDLSWDIAFHRWDVRTNSGKSGKGKGGAFKSEVTSLDAAQGVKLGTFTEDVMGKIRISFQNMGGGNHQQDFAEASINKILSGDANTMGWIDAVTMPPTYEIFPNVYFIRTADGSVVAMKFTNYRSAELKTGFITFDYVYVKQ